MCQPSADYGRRSISQSVRLWVSFFAISSWYDGGVWCWFVRAAVVMAPVGRGGASDEHVDWTAGRDGAVSVAAPSDWSTSHWPNSERTQPCDILSHLMNHRSSASTTRPTLAPLRGALFLVCHSFVLFLADLFAFESFALRFFSLFYGTQGTFFLVPTKILIFNEQMSRQ